MFLNREILKGICTLTLVNMKTASLFIKLLYIKTQIIHESKFVMKNL